MSEVRVSEFVRRAEAAVALPDLGTIVSRGHRRRRLRESAALAGVTAVVAAVGALVVARGPGGDPRPVEPLPVQVPPYPGGIELPALEPGTYEQELAREVTAASARFTVPEGWHGWYGPNLPYLREGYAGLLVGDVERVARTTCPGPVSPMRPVGQSPDDLVAALVALPRHQVVEEPSPTTLSGLPATHLVVERHGDARCPSGDELWDSPGAGGLIPAAGPRSRIELWVVDLDGEAVLVSATTGPGTPDRALAELESIVESVEIRSP